MDETQGALPFVAPRAMAAPGALAGGAAENASQEATSRGALLALLTLQAAIFALAGASGKIPATVITLFRALLTF